MFGVFITIVIVLKIFYEILLYFSGDQVSAAIDSYSTNIKINNLLLVFVVLQILYKGMVFILFIYSFILGINFVLFDLKNKRNKLKGI